jgi:hypothetical protein
VQLTAVRPRDMPSKRRTFIGGEPMNSATNSVAGLS